MDSLPFDPEPPSDEEVAGLRREFEAGDFFALNEVFFRLAIWGRPLPEWVFVGVNKALEGAWVRNAGSKGQRAGGYRTRSQSYLLHFARHDVASRHLAARGGEGGPRTREDAFELARVELAKTFQMAKAELPAGEIVPDYRGSANAIEKSYDLIQGMLNPDGQSGRAKRPRRPVNAE